ncbi:MAG TPA: D-aminoacylase [Bryobacteraceae bacterium]|jgi:dihydroorotase/N-acyl-D-amino-acid deacylase|nr:D-aminoacylase [Bryobacteraceae bacterium]
MLRSLFAVIFLGCNLSFAQSYDLLIQNGRIFDGTGNPWFYGDIAVQGDTIVQVGRIPPKATAKQRIDAKGQVVSPGFIDIHSHARRGIFLVPSAENVIRQGVTLVVEGPDGSSPIPLKPFFEKLAAIKFGVNFAMFAGQGSIREAVMGTQNRPATPEELEKMRELMRDAMRDGAFGMSTGLFYVPGNFTPPDEVIEVAKVAGELGGIHISHVRDEAEGIIDSTNETIRIGELGHMPTQLTHHKVMGKPYWGRSKETLRLADEARARGVDVTADAYPYDASSTGTGALFPQWALEGGLKSLRERLGAPDSRAKIKAEIVNRIMTARGGGDPKNVALASCDFDKTLAGKNLAQLTEARGQKPTAENAAETAIDLQSKGGCSAVYHAMSEEDVERILRWPHTMIASDGGIQVMGEGVPHPRSYGTFARVLGYYVREKKILTLEDAIRKMTSLPADRLNLGDRGILRPGMKADIAVFNPATVVDKATFENPHQYAEGVSHVVVNGKLVLSAGKMTGELPGRILYGPAKE